MDEKPLYGLERTVFRQLLHLFSRYADVIEKVILFGSRARGDYKEGSDIDLAIQFRKPGGPLYLLQSDLDELPIIYPIDVVDYNQIHNEQLKMNIDQEGKTIFQTNEHGKVMVTMSRLMDRFYDFERALSKLRQSAARDAQTDDLVVDATIQRFEFTYELAWKWMKLYLEHQGYAEVTSPRKTIREAFREGLIQDGETWLRMLEDRNRTSHTYDEETAMDMYERIRTHYIPLFDRLLDEMKRQLDSVT
ncbi:nucleotidyltransferase [Geobacillus stearothermophilus]|uniref:Nucleotidyltransferase n=1 Tax=Bacillus caldolyticus TaxID=1394 RepID=A0ABM6QSV3_BACCL|nr:HI0074 family nucleotidyltransferase substrate-binding subunit [[Bacillus] caldolyticus]AUI38324.1 nucleotidyltransferase [[Bacillus] caldolyticus]QHN50973.1 nucleotidyltransferase [Geobacillus stearothermophilus]